MRKEKAIKLINTAHSQDIKTEVFNNTEFPAELLYSNRCADWLLKLNPEANELQELAARCQHFKRWEIARNSYPMDRKGYHQWRISLYQYQAEEAGKIIAQAGYSEEEVTTVKKMVSKTDLRKDKDTQLIEDVACLVFLEFYMEPFAASKQEYSEEKWIKIIQKTWNKMSDNAHAFALKIDYPQDILALIQKALA